MDVEEIIDQALLLGDNVSPTSADYLLRRRLALLALRETDDELWWSRDWPWRRRNNVPLTVPAATGYATLPLDFSSLGVFGGVFTSEGDELDEVPESVIWDYNAKASYSGDSARYFAIHGQDETTRLPYIMVPRPTSALSLVLFYQALPPFILDAGDTDGYGTVSGVGLTYSSATGLVTAAATDHGFDNGQDVVIAGANEAGYNGSWQVTVTGKDSFTYTPSSTPAATPATGAITATLDVDKANRSILRIPHQYHQSILTWGVRGKLRESKGDSRWEYAQAQYVKGLKAAMVEDARMQSRRQGRQQLPSFFGRGVY